MSNVNISIFSLSVHTLSQSPYLSLQNRKLKGEAIFYNLHAKRFYSNFIYSSTSQNIRIDSSKFKCFLNSPIHIDGYIINNTKYFKNVAVMPFSESVVVQNTVFNTISTSSNGAAIFIKDDYSDLTVNFSNFENCISTSNGGAIYCNGGKVHVDFISAKECTAMESGQFIYSMSKRYNSEFAIGDSTILQCSSEQLIGGSRSISTRAVVQDFHHSNVTRCSVVEEGSSFFSSNSKKLVFRCSIFSNTTGRSGFVFCGLSLQTILEDCAIIESHVHQYDAIISLDESYVNFERFSFIRNRKCTYFSGNNFIRLLNSQIDEDFREGMFMIEHRLVLNSFGTDEVLPNDCSTEIIKYKKLTTNKPKAKKNAFKRSSALFLAAVFLLYFFFIVVNLASKPRRKRIPNSLL